MPHLSEVFVTQGKPQYTYVSVTDGAYENDLENAIRNKGTLCLLTGPSKTGKTTLVHEVCAKMNRVPVVVRCDKDTSTEEFWRRALEDVTFERLETVTHSKTTEVGLEGSISGALGWKWLAKLAGEFKSSWSKELTEEDCRARILARPSAHHLVPLMHASNALLVIEDFHYLPLGTMKTVFQQWKIFVDSRVSVVVLGTTHHACDLADANTDLVGRIAKLEMTTWLEGDLTRIILSGCDALRIDLDPSTMRVIAEESAGLPLLTQAICLELFNSLGYHETQKVPTRIVVERPALFKAMTKLAQSRFSQFEDRHHRLAEGIRTDKKKYPTYECLLMAFAEDPIAYKLKLDKLIERIDGMKLDDKPNPPPQSIKHALAHLNTLQRKIGTELLEWMPRTKSLYITEPSFLFYLRWHKTRRSRPTLRDIVKDIVFAHNVTFLKQKIPKRHDKSG